MVDNLLNSVSQFVIKINKPENTCANIKTHSGKSQDNKLNRKCI